MFNDEIQQIDRKNIRFIIFIFMKLFQSHQSFILIVSQLLLSQYILIFEYHSNMCSIYCAFLCTFYALFASIENLPVIPTSSVNGSDSQVPPHVLNFLQKYGYLSFDDIHSNHLNSQRKLDFLIHDAIKKLQSSFSLPITGIADNSTLELIKKPRCSYPDFFPTSAEHRVKRYSLFGSKWPTLSITYKIQDYPSNLPREIFESEVRFAAYTWTKNSRLSMHYVQEGSADIIISFPPRYHWDGSFDGSFDGPGGDVGHAFAPGPNRGGDVHLDRDEKWVRTMREPYDDHSLTPIYRAVLHELGHSLGLNHYSDLNAIMYPAAIKHWYLGEDLGQDDKNGIRHLYGYRESSTKPTVTPLYTLTTVSWPDPYQTPRIADHTAPETCDTSFDAVAYIRTEIFFFTRRHYWRLKSDGVMTRNYSQATDAFWKGLPSSFDRVDAAYMRPSDQLTMIFIGKQYWIYDGPERPERGYPKTLYDLGLPQDLERIDAAFVFGESGSVYFFSGKQYWKFDEKTNRVEVSYPRNVSFWKGVPENVDAALTTPKEPDIVYFFKGKFFWEYDKRTMAVKSDKPRSSVHKWFYEECKNTPEPSYNGFAHISSPNTVLVILLLILVPMLSSRFD